MFSVIRKIVNVIVGVIEFLLTLRFVFMFFGANPRTPFVAWIYGATAALVRPFANIFPDWRLGEFVVDFATVIALVVYAFIGYLILLLFSRVGSRKYAVR